MAYYITEPLGGSDDVVVSVYKNTGEYVGNIIVDRYKWRMSSDEETRYSIGQFKAENAESRNPSYDCGENVELFKALAAMNDENDRAVVYRGGSEGMGKPRAVCTHWELRKMLAGASGRYPRP